MREKQLQKDRDAYRRLRENGVQPRMIDGSARAEAEANTTAEVELKEWRQLSNS